MRYGGAFCSHKSASSDRPSECFSGRRASCGGQPDAPSVRTRAGIVSSLQGAYVFRACAFRACASRRVRGGAFAVPEPLRLFPHRRPFPDVPDPLLEAVNLVKQYDTGGEEPLTVLSDLALSVRAGEIVAVVGESGTGKSTLLHVLGALDRPTAGTVRFEGTDLFAKSDDELAAFRNRAIGFVFQFHHLLPEFTALENVAMPALIQQQSLDAAAPRARTLLDLLGLADRADHRPRTLSGGEKQRVAIARALMNEPALVLMDEPTGNLDARTAEPMHREIERLSRDMEQTFVLATHDPSLARIADRALRLELGRLHPLSASDDMATASRGDTARSDRDAEEENRAR